MLSNTASILMYVLLVLGSSLMLFYAQKYEIVKPALSRVLLVLTMIFLIIPLACRNYGVDDDGYRNFYNQVTCISFIDFWKTYNGTPEPLFALINQFAYLTQLKFRGVYVISAIISVSLYYLGIWKLRKYTNMGIAGLYAGCTMYIFMYGLVRIGIAVAVVSFTLPYLIENKKTQFFAGVILATGFHYSALIMIPVFILVRLFKDMNDFKFIIIAVALALLMIVCIKILNPFLTSNLPLWSRYYYIAESEINLKILFNEAITAVLWILIFIALFQKVPFTADEKTLIQLSGISLAIIIASIQIPNLHRLTYYFYPVNAVLYGMMLRRIENRELRMPQIKPEVLKWIFISGILIMTVLWILNETMINAVWAPFLVPYVFA